MNSYLDVIDDLERLGFDLYSGCRVEAWEYANEIGIPNSEIIQKFSDDEVLAAIWESAQVMGMLGESHCPNCGFVVAGDLMECDRCGVIFCDDCGIFPPDGKYCSIYCLKKDGKYGSRITDEGTEWYLLNQDKENE